MTDEYLEILITGLACFIAGAGILSWGKKRSDAGDPRWIAAVEQWHDDRDASQPWAKDGRYRWLGWILIAMGLALLAIVAIEN